VGVPATAAAPSVASSFGGQPDFGAPTPAPTPAPAFTMAPPPAGGADPWDAMFSSGGGGVGAAPAAGGSAI
jgi:hypothetical protein